MPVRRGKKRASEKVSGETDTAGAPKKVKSVSRNTQFSLTFEHWAMAIAEDLRAVFGETEVEYNPSAPRRGSFEITLHQNSEKDVLIWSGLKKGPPRKLKFPEAADIATEIKKHLKDNV